MEKEEIYFNELVKRLNQRVKLLVANPNFQVDVKEIRKTFNIPLSGIKDQPSTEKWYRDLYEGDNQYFRNVWGRRRHEIIKLRKSKKFKEAIDLQKELNNAAPLNALSISIKNVIKEYKLPLSWQGSIRRYVLFNDPNNLALPAGIEISVGYDKDTGLRKLSIEIQGDTRLKDIKQAWPYIKFHQKLLHSHTKEKFQPIKRFSRDQEAYDLKQSGKSYAEIADTLSEKSGQSISYDDVSSYIKRYKQEVGIN